MPSIREPLALPTHIRSAWILLRYLAYNAPHTPLQAPAADLRRARGSGARSAERGLIDSVHEQV